MNCLRLSLLALLWTTKAFAADAPSARADYDAGRYAEASQAYELLLKDAPRDSTLHYNLGNALFKSGKLGRAAASYERAFAIDPRDQDIRFNLAFVLKLAGEKFVPPGTPPSVFWAFTALSERELAGLHWVAAWASLILAAMMLLRRDRRREALAPWTVAFFSVWLVLGLWWGSLRTVLPPDRGVIVAPRAEIRHGPGPNFGVAFTVPEGRRVRVLGASGTWLEVGVLEEGARGWIQASSVERL